MFDLKNNIKNMLQYFVQTATPSVRPSEGRNAEPSRTIYGDSYWYASPNLWEPTVMLALRDLCKPGKIGRAHV